MLPLPRNLYLTLRKCCACHTIGSLGKLDLAKVRRLPRNLYITLQKCCAYHAIETSRVLDLAKVLRLSRNLYSTLRKCCPCHEICDLAKPSCCRANGPALREWSDGPRLDRPGAANRLAFSSPETPIPAQGHAFCTFLFSHHTRTHIFSRAYFLLLSSVSES